MKRLKELREQKHMSQQALAEVLHVTQQSVYKYEHGLAVPDLDILIHISDFFNTSIDYLVEATDNPVKFEFCDHSSLTRDELRLLTYYRALSPKIKELIQEVIEERNTLIEE